MNQFNVSIKRADGSYAPIEGQAVRPFRWGELLDERLDEAYLNTINDPVQHYKPLTELKITLDDGDSTEEMNFIVATDSGQECPVGSGLYKHEIYLIERTKLLEGILCPSLTFTNPLGKEYTSVLQSRVNANFTASPNPTESFYGVSSITTPIQSKCKNFVPSPRIIGTALEDAYKTEHPLGQILKRYDYYDEYPDITGKSHYSTVSIYFDDKLFLDKHRGEFTIEPVNLINVSRARYVYDVLLVQVLAATSNNTQLLHYRIEFEISVVSNISNQKRKSITDCVIRVLECAEPLFRFENPRYTFDGANYENGKLKWYDADNKYRPGSQAEKYDKIIAPEFTMTQCTLREQLKIIGGFIHGEPWLDENDVVHYLDYGNTTSSDAGNYPYYYEAGRTDINQHCTEIVSNVQNLVSSLGYAKGVIYDPSDSLYRSVRTEVAYGRVTEDNGIAVTNKPIYHVIAAKCGMVGTDGTSWYLEPKDITPYVFEETEYNANLSSYAGAFPYSKEYAIYYKMGSNNLGGLFFRAPNAINDAAFSKYAIANILAAVNQDTDSGEIKNAVDANPQNIVFQIAYKPIVSTMVSHGKTVYLKDEPKFAQVYNQGENLIETQFYGENLKGVAARLGNIERERTFLLSKLQQIPKAGQMLGDYAISAVNVEQYPHHIKCTVGLSKEFNRISQYIGINSAKRMYQVSEREAYARNTLLREILVVGTLPDDIPEAPCGIFYNIKAFRGIFDRNIENEKISFAKMTTYTKDGSPMYQNVFPVMPIALGNTITFSFSPKDNYSAGDTTQFITSGHNDIEGRWMTDARYTDIYGGVYWAGFNFYSNILSIAPIEEASFDLPSADANELYRYFGTPQFGTDRTGFYRLRKDNREVPSITVELEFKTNVPGLIIGSAMAEYCKYISNEDIGELELWLLGEPGSITKFDRSYTPNAFNDRLCKKGDASSVRACWNIDTTDVDNVLKFRPIKLLEANATDIPEKEFYGWVLISPIREESYDCVDEDGYQIEETVNTGGRIFLASTTPFKGTDTIMNDLYMYFSKD